MRMDWGGILTEKNWLRESQHKGPTFKKEWKQLRYRYWHRFKFAHSILSTAWRLQIWLRSYLSAFPCCDDFVREDMKHVLLIYNKWAIRVHNTEWFHITFWKHLWRHTWRKFSRRSNPVCPVHHSFGYIAVLYCPYPHCTVGESSLLAASMNQQPNDHDIPEGQAV